MPLPISPYDRLSVAVQNLLEADPYNAARSLVAPSSLPPSKVQTMAEEMGMGDRWSAEEKQEVQNSFLGKHIEKEKKAGSPVVEGMGSLLTDPFFIITTAIGMKWPMLPAQKMFKVAERFAGYTKKLGFLEKWFGRGAHLFRGTNLPHLAAAQQTQLRQFRKTYQVPFLEKLDEFKKTAGHFPTKQEQTRVMAKLMKMDKAGQSVVKVPHGTEIKGKLISDSIQLTSAEKMLHDYIDQTYMPRMFKEVVGPMMMKGREKAVSVRDMVNSIKRSKILQGFSEEDAVIQARAIARGRQAERGKAAAQQMKAYSRGSFMPKVLVKDESVWRDYVQTVDDVLSAGTPQDAAKRASALLSGPVAGTTRPALGALLPDTEALKAAGLRLNPEVMGKINTWVRNTADDITRLANRNLMNTELPVEKRIYHLKTKVLKPYGISTGTKEGQRVMDQVAGALEAGRPADAYRIVEPFIVDAYQTRKFSTDLLPVMSHYVSSLSNPYVWRTVDAKKALGEIGALSKAVGTDPKTIKKGQSIGEAIEDTIRKIKDPTLQNIAKSDYLPLLQGQLNAQQLPSVMTWNTMKLRMLDDLRNPEGMAKLIPKRLNDKLQKIIAGGGRTSGWMTTQNKVAGWFYHSTIGFNPSSSLKNMLQPVISTGPLVGFRNYFKGLGMTQKRAMQFFALKSKGMTTEKAFAKAFPEYVRAGMKGPHLGSARADLVKDALGGAWSQGQYIAQREGMRGLQKLKNASMFMFSQSERFNRVSSFYAGLAKANADGLARGPAGYFARRIVEATQFPAGPMQMPRALTKLSAPWRQFMYFPTRYLGLMGLEAPQMGTGAGVKGLARWSVPARAAAASAATSQGAEQAGVDLNPALMMSALPFPQFEHSPFAPFPMVPPLASVAGSLGQAAFFEDPRALEQAGALMAPGGVSLRRAYRALAPKYADYQNRTPDGRIPVYGRNRSLKGYMTPTELTMKALGFRPLTESRERGVTEWLIKNRDNLRQARREYTEALFKNDYEKAQQLQDQFKRSFPEMRQLSLKKSDINAIERRHDMTRIQRLMETLPVEYRGRFREIISGAMMEHMWGQMPMGSEPETLGLGEWEAMMRQSDVGGQFMGYRGGGYGGYGGLGGMNPSLNTATPAPSSSFASPTFGGGTQPSFSPASGFQ